MSSVGLDGDPYLFSQEGSFDAPYTFTVPATLEVRTDAASAGFDGSGSSGAYLPAISFYSPSGVHIGTYPIQSAAIPQGGSCEVSWSPFVPVASAAAPAGGGIEFDTSPQDGDWLLWRTTAASGAPFGYGLHVQDESDAGILIEATGASSSNLLIENDHGDVTISSDSRNLSVTNSGTFPAVFGCEGDAQAVFESHATGGDGVLIRNRDQGNMHLENEGNGNITLECDGNGSIHLAIDGSGFVTISGLPTVNPGGTGRVWNNSGVLNIT